MRVGARGHPGCALKPRLTQPPPPHTHTHATSEWPGGREPPGFSAATAQLQRSDRIQHTQRQHPHALRGPSRTFSVVENLNRCTLVLLHKPPPDSCLAPRSRYSTRTAASTPKKLVGGGGGGVRGWCGEGGTSDRAQVRQRACPRNHTQGPAPFPATSHAPSPPPSPPPTPPPTPPPARKHHPWSLKHEGCGGSVRLRAQRIPHLRNDSPGLMESSSVQLANEPSTNTFTCTTKPPHTHAGRHTRGYKSTG